jgi:hypothetical protein
LGNILNGYTGNFMAIRILTSTIDSASPTDTTVFFSLVGPDSVGTYRVADFSVLAGSVLDGSDVENFIITWIAANLATANAGIDAGNLAINTDENNAKAKDLRDEAKQFLADNPAAKAIIDLDGAVLETTIETRTATQETLLLKTLAFAVRFLFESVRLQD